MRVEAGDRAVWLELSNPLGAARLGVARLRDAGGRGLAGMHRRVTLLRG